MTILLTSQGMATWPPAKTWDSTHVDGTLATEVSADEEVYESRVQISGSGNESIRNPSILRSLIKTLFMLVAFTLPLVSSSVHVQDDVAVDVETFSDNTGNYAPNISNSERLYESPKGWVETADILPSASDDAFAWPSLEYRGRADVEETTNSLWASGHAKAPFWMQGFPLATFPSKSQFKLSNTCDTFGSDYDNPEKGEEVTAPAVNPETRLARLTVYWPEEGDHHTVRRISSSGVRLRDGHCAVDPKVIPYGSVVKIPGIGEYVAVDTGPAVVSRRAARSAGRTSRERSALVVDVFCSSRSKARVFAATVPMFTVISWSR
jgi:3D (Asp-Asp-Asp) domain-containing protein